MDVEFHYYMTYLIATKAGFTPDQSLTLAHASQFVDDNDIIFHIDKDRASGFMNYISQTMNILKPKTKLMRIYPVFHFIPGAPMQEGARRKDGMLHMLNCTPNSPNANTILDTVLAQCHDSPYELYWIGIALHGFADTWAHQNFTGTFCDFNGIYMEKGLTVGHAQAGHNPDEPALVWKDSRLIENRVDNRTRFLEAAETIFEKLALYINPKLSPETLLQKKTALRSSLDKAINRNDQANQYQKERIERYKELAENEQFGETRLEEYNPELWFDEAVSEEVKGFRDRKMELYGFDLSRFDPLTDVYTWKDRNTYQETAWFKFQTAIKRHQELVLEILRKGSMSYVQLPDTIPM